MMLHGFCKDAKHPVE